MTNNKQQTSVEWLEIELEKLWVEKYLSPITIKPLLDKAKEMEKDRIETAYNKGTVNGIDYPESTLPLTGEQYYNETYGDYKQ